MPSNGIGTSYLEAHHKTGSYKKQGNDRKLSPVGFEGSSPPTTRYDTKYRERLPSVVPFTANKKPTKLGGSETSEKTEF